MAGPLMLDVHLSFFFFFRFIAITETHSIPYGCADGSLKCVSGYVRVCSIQGSCRSNSSQFMADVLRVLVSLCAVQSYDTPVIRFLMVPSKSYYRGSTVLGGRRL